MKDEDDKKIKLTSGDTGPLAVSGITGRIEPISAIPNFTGLSREDYEASKIFANPSFYGDGYKSILEGASFRDARSAVVLGNEVAFPSFSPVGAIADLETGISGLGLYGNRNENLTREEIENLIKKHSSKDESISKEQALKMFKEYEESKNNQEQENFLKAYEKGLNIISKELLKGKYRKWYCGMCPKFIDEFKGEEGIKKINKYLVEFRNNLLKKCGNGHENWFEIKEDGVVWLVKVIFEKNFK